MARAGWICAICLTVCLLIEGAFNPLKAITDRLPKLSVQIERMEDCNDPAARGVFQDIVISQQKFNLYTFDCILNISEQINGPLNLKLDMYRCKDKEVSDSCEFYFSAKKSGFCEDFKAGKHSWDFFMNSTDLPMSCPLQQGVYKVRNASADLSALNSFPFFNSYWRLKALVLSEETLAICVVLELQVEMVSGRRRLG